MPGETRDEVSGWTVDTARSDLLQRISSIHDIISERDQRYQQRFLAQEEAIRKEELAAKEWRLGSNEWRDAMTDREQKFLPRIEAQQLFSANADKIAALDAHLTTAVASITSRLDLMTGRSTGVSELAGWIFGGVSFAAAIIAIFFNLR